VIEQRRLVIAGKPPDDLFNLVLCTALSLSLLYIRHVNDREGHCEDSMSSHFVFSLRASPCLHSRDSNVLTLDGLSRARTGDEKKRAVEVLDGLTLAVVRRETHTGEHISLPSLECKICG
jgi:hypothetical protein